MEKPTFTANPNDSAIVTTYVFDAPPERVFAAYTDSALTPKWWGEGDLRVDAMDVRPGGGWRFVQSEKGQEYAFRGFYHTVEVPQKLVSTWEFEGMPIVMLDTVTFEEMPDGKTKVTDRSVFQSTAERDAMRQAGMDEAATVGMLDRLAALL